MTVGVGRLGVLLFDGLPESRKLIMDLVADQISDDAQANDDLHRWISPYELASWLKYDALRPALDQFDSEVLGTCIKIIKSILMERLDDLSLDREAVILRVVRYLSIATDIPKISLLDRSLASYLVDTFGQYMSE